eukprot:7174105-Alexandrium_andersonii.AAC.1
MSASLVGSEMCIRDSPRTWRRNFRSRSAVPASSEDCGTLGGEFGTSESVSYTHLTLPTICSV